jgi:hypothetical protein
MRLPLVSKRRSKKAQALDTVASVAKVWSEWHLARAAAGGVRRGAKTAGKGYVVAKATPRRSLGIFVAAFALAVVAVKKLRGGDDGATAYAPPPPAPTTPVPDPDAPAPGQTTATESSGPVNASSPSPQTQTPVPDPDAPEGKGS